MTWENYGFGEGKWTIDHIKPFAECDPNNIEELVKNNHYTNLRPMWFMENIMRYWSS